MSNSTQISAKNLRRSLTNNPSVQMTTVKLMDRNYLTWSYAAVVSC